MSAMNGSTDRRRRARSHGSRGQSLVELALVLPLALGLMGSGTDFARVYQAWITLQGSTRIAAEAAATQSTTATAAQSIATQRACSEMAGIAGFAGTLLACTNPTVAVTSFDRSHTAPGASMKYPLTTVTVQSRFEFDTLFAYPLLTDEGSWTLQVESTYSVLQGR